MNIIKKLSLRHLKQNKSRTVLTVLGIAVSSILLTVLVVASSSFLHYYGEKTVYSNGDYHFYVKTTYQKANEVLNDPSLESVGYQAVLPDDEMGYKIYSNKANYVRVGTFFAGDGQCLKDMVTCDYDGRFPKNDSEIMVEQSLLDDNALDLKIGDTIKIAVGERKEGEFSLFPITGDFRFGETFSKTSDKTYKIVGILHNNEATVKTYGKILRGVNQNELKNCIALCKFKKITPLSYSKADEIIDKFGFDKRDRIFSSSINEGYLMSKLSFSNNVNDLKSNLPLILIFVAAVAIILLVSFAMIFNAFSLSFGEQLKYLGMLSSVGATKKQKKRALYFEGAVLGGIGVPLGVLTGAAGTAVLQKLLNSKITSLITDYNDNIKYTTCVPVWALLCVVIFGMLTVFVSIIVPVRKTSEVSAIEAIRRQTDIKQKHKIRTPRIILKTLGVSGDIAYKNMKRCGTKSRTIIASIAVSVVLFLCCNYFCSVYTQVTGSQYELPYQVTFNTQITSEEDLKNIRDLLSSNSDIKRFYSVTDEFYLLNDKVFNDGHFDDTAFIAENMTDEYKFIAQNDMKMTVNVYYIDDDEFNSLCKSNGIDYKKYYSLGNENTTKALLLNTVDKSNDKVFNRKMLGQTVGDYEIDYEKSVDKTDSDGNQIYVYKDTHAIASTICDFIKYDKNNTLLNLDNGCIDLYVPLTMYKEQLFKYIKALNDEFDETPEYPVTFAVETDNSNAVETKLKDYLSEHEREGVVYNEHYWAVRERSVITITKWLSYGFILLITLITVFNILNTVSTQIANRKKEFAMLKSVGMTPKEFNKMIALESGFYGFYGLLFGIPISLVINKIIGTVVSKSDPIPFSVNVPIYIVAVIAVFVFVGAAMLCSSKLLKIDGVAQTLKEDID